MSREITAKILLNLKDQFSSQIKGAGISVQGFANKAVGMAEKVNKAFSGVAGTLGTLGVSIGALSAVKSTIDLDHRMVRLGLTANASTKEVNDLKRQIFDTAQLPDVKLDTDSIISGLEVIMTKVGDLQFVKDNVYNIALALQASGESGESMGAVFAEFAKFGYTMEEILPLMNDLIAQGDQGAFTFGEFAKNAPAVFSAYSAIGTTPEHIRRANAAMQILMAGTKSADIAVTALNSTMAELGDPDKQKKLRNLGINVRDLATNEFRDFNDIMFDIVAKAEEMGNADFFGTIFGTTSMQAIRAYLTQGGRMYDSLVNLGDTAGLLQKKSAAMANTLKSNFQNLQTAFLSFADENLAGPLRDLTLFFNELAKDPENIEKGIRGIAAALGVLAGIRLGAGIVSFIANLASIKSKGGLDVSGLANAAGGAGIPVHVTNWGGVGGSTPMPGVPLAPSVPAAPAGASILSKAGPYAAFVALTLGLGHLIDKIGTSKYEIDGKHHSEWDKEARYGFLTGDRKRELEARIAQLKIEIPEYEMLRAGFGTDEQFQHVGFDNEYEMVVLDDLRNRLAGLQKELASMEPVTVNQNGIRTAANGIQTLFPGSPGLMKNPTMTSSLSVNDLIVTPRGQFTTHPEDYILAMKDPAALITAGIPAVQNRYQTFQGTPGVRTGNNAIPQDLFTPRPDDYILTMKDPETGGAAHIPERAPLPPVVVEGEIVLHSELSIDDKGGRLRQSVARNTTPYKFTVGSAKNARMIQ
jgi:uncharacterized small protein (DUF1192 family)